MPEKEIVRDVIRKIPSNGNPLVYENLVDAALAMTAEVAAPLIDQTIAWLKAVHQVTLLPEKLGALAAHLARGGKTQEAVKLAATLLAPQADPRNEKASDDPEFAATPEPQAQFDLWLYEQILKKDIPDLVASAGIAAFNLLSDLLDQAIKLSQRRGNDGPEDLSYIWRPAVEDHEQNQLPELKSLLISAVRDAAEQIVRTDERLLTKVIQELESKRPAWRIFTRVALPRSIAFRMQPTQRFLRRDF